MMRQAIHIFKKDVRRLRLEIGGVFLLVLAFVVAEIKAHPAGISDLAEVLELLLYAAWVILIARVIHGEPIPGDSQFWLTRPYDRKSLWTAKSLLALTVIHLPLLAAQATILAAKGVSVASNVPGLLWEQVLVAAVVVLPAAVLAAVTATMVQYVLAAILWAAVASITVSNSPANSMGPLGWVPMTGAISSIAIVGCTALYLQFLRRRTSLSRILGGGGTVLALAACLLITWDSAFAVQSWLSPFDGALTISLDQPRITLPRSWIPRNQVRVDVPLQATGIDLNRMRLDLSRITLGTSSGVLKVDMSKVDQFPSGFAAVLSLDQSVFDKIKNQAVRLRGTIFLTELGEEHVTTLLVGGGAADVPGVGHCFTAPFPGVETNQLVCRAAFRRPGSLTRVRNESGSTTTLEEIDSYSPFPAILAIRPIATKFVVLRANDRRVDIVTRDPVAHRRYDFEFPEVRLAGYLPPAP